MSENTPTDGGDRQRFLLELEFVNALASPPYINCERLPYITQVIVTLNAQRATFKPDLLSQGWLRIGILMMRHLLIICSTSSTGNALSTQGSSCAPWPIPHLYTSHTALSRERSDRLHALQLSPQPAFPGAAAEQGVQDCNCNEERTGTSIQYPLTFIASPSCGTTSGKHAENAPSPRNTSRGNSSSSGSTTSRTGLDTTGDRPSSLLRLHDGEQIIGPDLERRIVGGIAVVQAVMCASRPTTCRNAPN